MKKIKYCEYGPKIVNYSPNVLQVYNKTLFHVPQCTKQEPALPQPNIYRARLGAYPKSEATKHSSLENDILG